MKCRINRNIDGSIESVINEQGDKSVLFEKLSKKIGENKALDVFALTETEDFKNIQSLKTNKIIENNKTILANQVRQFASSILATQTQRLNSFVYSNGDVNLYFKPVYGSNKTIEAELIETKSEARGKGLARGLFEDFLKKAGAQGFTVIGVISPRDSSTKENKLKQFYKSLGFENNGTDFEIIRRPQKSDKNDIEIKPTVDEKSILPIPVEPTVEEAVSFATKQDGVLSNEDKVQLDNAVYSLGFSSYGEIISKIENSLLQDGMFVFTESVITKSGMYNKYETNYILNSIEAQNEIKRVYQGLKNSENKILESVNPIYVIKTSNVNALGKQIILNPYSVEKEITSIVAGKDLSISLDDIPYDSIKNAYNSNPAFKEELDNIAKNNRNIPAKKVELGELADKTVNNNRELFEKTLDLDARDILNPIISLIEDVSPTVWKSSLDSLYSIFKDFRLKAINSGIDFLDLEDKVLIKSQEEITDLLVAFSDVMNNPNENNMDYFFNLHTEFFDVSPKADIKTVNTTNENNVFLDSDVSELSLFENFGLIKESEKVYRQIEVTQGLDEAYDVLFSNKDKIPQDVKTIEELKQYVNNIISKYDVDDFNINLSDLESMVVHKLYFNSPINLKKPSDNYATQKFSNFTGDFNYLTKVFPSDFYKEYLKEKNRNSDLFKNFYSNFTVSEKGIVLLKNDPMTIAQMEPYIDENLSMYNLISKNLNLPLKQLEVNDNIDRMQFKREYAISNPGSVSKVKGDFMVMSPEIIAVRNETESFVKTPSGIYEIDYQQGDITFYNKLAEGSEYYNSYGQYPVKTSSSLDLRDFQNLEITPDSFIKAKNYYSDKELENINSEHFSC